MPSVNIYTNEKNVDKLEKSIIYIKEFIAKKLSCDNRKVEANEISIRIIVPSVSSTISETEIVMIAHSYPERIQKQDEICLSIKNFIVSLHPSLKSTYVWLQLSELGHSE